MRKTIPTSFRLSEEARSLLGELAERLGVSRTGIVEMMIRDLARREGLDPVKAPAVRSSLTRAASRLLDEVVQAGERRSGRGPADRGV